MSLPSHTSADMSFLTIPSQEGLFTATKTDKAAEEGARSRTDADENEDEEEEEEDDAEDVHHLIPRCSPVPRKRGASIFDETAEYMRIHQALCTGKRVSFADTTGGDLVDVREFHAFDSDEEEGSAKWEEEEAKYRRAEREPSYSVRAEFHAPGGGVLLQAVRAGKVEVEQVCPVEDEPLAFSGLIRVLNVSFHKAVYIRSTMDSWATYFDHPAEYVQGSNDGETDQFSFKLSFAPPYTTHGSRIEFVVRYETSDGDYWANNSSLNYVVTLILSYKDDPVQANTDAQQKRSILKPCKLLSVDDEDDDDGEASEEDQEKAEAEELENSTLRLIQPAAASPVILQPEIDIENAVQPSGSSVPLDHRPPSVEGTPSTHAVFQAEQLPHTPSETNLHTDPTFGPNIDESDQPDESQPSPRHQCEPQKNTSEQSINTSPSAVLPASTPLSQESEGRSDESQAERGESSDSECLSATEVKLLSTTQEDGLTELEPPAERVFSHSLGFQTDLAVGLSECAERLSKVSMKSEAHHVGITAEPLSPVAETAAPIVAEGETQPLPDLTVNPSVNPRPTSELNQDTASRCVSASGENDDASQNSLSDNSPNTLDLSEPWSELDINRNLMPCVFFLSGVVSLSVVMQEPSALFFIGLLLVLHRL